MNTLFHYTDPNLISTILQNELNNIVNYLAPPKTVNYETNYAPYLNKNLREKQKSQKAYLKRAIASNNINDWREYRNFRNTLTKEIKIEKTKYIKEKFNNTEKVWDELKVITKTNKIVTPQLIKYGKYTVSCPKF